KKSFIQNPLHNNYIDIVYKTNDLAYYDENKNLVFQGRKDFQIKHLGHRIELEEIECNINKIAGVNRAVVIFLSEKSKLIGFYDGSIGEIEILKELQNVLPRYMIPSKIIKLASFPLNKNGKIDRKLLKEAYLV
ncbi:TPA: D-alanine--poly(phosphoribitol) ligase, partial [Candidatus Avacholeplasma faecigallinarum]|nr:D-alanine--poly(phosphoribitol) ligase [Candidatus Avacholeplasma faecigallinarum]